MNPIDAFLHIIEESHNGNPDHYFTLRGYKLCARCSGIIFSLPFVYPIGIYLYTTTDNIPFYPVFFLSLFLGTLCLINWYIGKWKEVSNESRFISGILLSVGLTLYLFLLPDNTIETFTVKFLTLPLYLIFATLFISRERRKKNESEGVSQ